MGKFFLVFFALVMTASAYSASIVKTHVFFTDKITTGASTAVVPLGLNRTFQVFGSTSAGSGASTINVEVSNDGTNFIILDVLSLTLGTTVTSDYFENNFGWKYVRGNVATISGTNAKVTLVMGGAIY